MGAMTPHVSFAFRAEAFMAEAGGYVLTESLHGMPTNSKGE